MPYTKQDLQALYTLSLEDVEQSLVSAKLPLERETYTDEEIQNGFDVIRNYFNSGQVSDYGAAASLFEQQSGNDLQPELQTKAKKSKNVKKSSASLSISELLSLASEQTGTRISLSEAGEILRVCDLADDQDYYSQVECERFLSACVLMKNRGVSGADDAGADNLEQVVERIGDSAVSTKLGLANLIDKVTEKQAEEIPGMVRNSFLKHVSHQLLESQANNDIFFAQLEERIMKQVEGKSRTRSLRAEREWKELPPSSPRQMSLPEGSENGTTDE